jgi:hypothetical protein
LLRERFVITYIKYTCPEFKNHWPPSPPLKKITTFISDL